MINVADSMSESQVLFRKMSFHYTEMDSNMKQFLQDVYDMKTPMLGPLFYSLDSNPMEEIIEVTFYMPMAYCPVNLTEGYQFQSFFYIENMISYVVSGDFNKKTEIGYRILVDYINDNEYKMSTPMFHIIGQEKDNPYMILKVGVTGKES